MWGVCRGLVLYIGEVGFLAVFFVTQIAPITLIIDRLGMHRMMRIKRGLLD
jgi:hypothetical protein